MRRWLDRAFYALTAACCLTACLILLGVVTTILIRAAPVLDWRLLTEPMTEGGGAGGVLYQILGTVLLMVSALAISAPMAGAMALVAAVYLKGTRYQRWLGLWLYALNGVPSIVLGIFGLMFFMKFLDWGKSWLSGGILLGLMILPTLTIALIERIECLPNKYIEAAAGLGLRRSQIIWSVILPQSFSGLVSGALLGLARAAGETAPIMFTAAVFSGATFPQGIRESPIVALPYHIFALAQDSFTVGAQNRVWGAAWVLLLLVFGLSLLALPIRLRIHEEAKHG